jgi:hypothetical protein
MSRSNYDKPFYVDVGTSIVAIRCMSNRDVLVQYDHVNNPGMLKYAQDVCDRMNREVEIDRPRRNCDRYATPDEAELAFDDYCHDRRENPTEVCRRKSCCDCQREWLYATAKEGEAK